MSFITSDTESVGFNFIWRTISYWHCYLIGVINASQSESEPEDLLHLSQPQPIVSRNYFVRHGLRKFFVLINTRSDMVLFHCLITKQSD
jgi:hypothetical protein